MPKPLINRDEVEFDDVEDNGCYTSRRALFSAGIGARKLGYNLTILPPGKAQCPFHAHRGEEEMFLILEGEGELRFGDQRYRIRAHDVIARPTGRTEMRYLALSNRAEVDACEHPDSNKVLVRADEPGTTPLRGMFRTEATVGYYDRERTQSSPRD